MAVHYVNKSYRYTDLVEKKFLDYFVESDSYKNSNLKIFEIEKEGTNGKKIWLLCYKSDFYPQSYREIFSGECVARYDDLSKSWNYLIGSQFEVNDVIPVDSFYTIYKYLLYFRSLCSRDIYQSLEYNYDLGCEAKEVSNFFECLWDVDLPNFDDYLKKDIYLTDENYRLNHFDLTVPKFDMSYKSKKFEKAYYRFIPFFSQLFDILFSDMNKTRNKTSNMNKTEEHEKEIGKRFSGGNYTIGLDFYGLKGINQDDINWSDLRSTVILFKDKKNPIVKTIEEDASLTDGLKKSLSKYLKAEFTKDLKKTNETRSKYEKQIMDLVAKMDALNGDEQFNALKKAFIEQANQISQKAFSDFREVFSKENDEIKIAHQRTLDLQQELLTLPEQLSQETQTKINSILEKGEKQFDDLEKQIQKAIANGVKQFDQLDSKREGVIKQFQALKDDYIRQISECSKDTFNEYRTYLQNEIDKINAFYQETKRLQQELQKLPDELYQLPDKLSRETEARLHSVISSGQDQLRTLESHINSAVQRGKKQFDALNAMREDIIDKLIQEVYKGVMARNPVQEIHIEIKDEDINRKIRGIYHRDFKKILQLISMKKPVFLVGPAGSGKNYILKQTSKVLGLDFYYTNDAREKYDLLGFVDANGVYQPTQFFKAFTKGGLFMLDEMDSADSSVLLLLNSALGTGGDFYMSFPDGKNYQAHPNFHLVAAANTFGNGSNQIYCGRNQLDGASINRFVPVYVDYDINLEKTLVNNKEILDFYWEIRRIVRENGLKYVVSTRNIINADEFLNAKTFSLDDIFSWTVVQGMTEDDLAIIYDNIQTNDKYSVLFKDYLRRTYHFERASQKQKSYWGA